MAGIRRIMLIAAWAAFIWMMINAARNQPISENFWINVAYLAGLIALTILIFVFAYPHIINRFRMGYAGMIILAIAVFFIIAAIDVFWLRDILTFAQ